MGYGLIAKTKPWIRLGSALLLFLLTAHLAHAKDPVQQLIQWTNENNPGRVQSTASFLLEYYEVPLRLMDARLSAGLNPKIRDSLVFQKNGEPYLRYMKHPTDTLYSWAVEKALEKEGLPSKPQKGALRAWNNASRSIYVEDPKIGYVFELKGSTNKAPGVWKDKPLKAGAIAEMAQRDDFVQRYGPRAKLRYTELTYEPASFVFKDQDPRNGGVGIGQIARDLGLQRNGKEFILPGYAALDSELGKQIALANGSADPVKFWEEHYIRTLARSMAELKTELGLEITSPHSQNFYIVLDEHLRPTGKIRHKDFTDGDFHSSLLEAKGMHLEGTGRGFETAAGRKGVVVIESSVLSGGQNPSWQFAFSGHGHHPWNQAFIDEFETEMAKLTGVPKTEWAKARVYVEPQAESTGKFMNYYPEDSGPWKKFIDNVKAGKLPKVETIAAKAGAAVIDELKEAQEILSHKTLTPAQLEKLKQLYRFDREAVIQALLELKLKGELTPEIEAGFQQMIKLPSNREVSPSLVRGLWELGDRRLDTTLAQLDFTEEYSVARNTLEYATEHKLREPKLLEKAAGLLQMIDKVHIPEDAAAYLIAVSPLDEQLLLKTMRDVRKLDRSPIYMNKLLAAQPLTPTLRAELVQDLVKRTALKTDALLILRKDPNASPLLVDVVKSKTASISEKSAALDLLTELRMTNKHFQELKPFLEEFSQLTDANEGPRYLIKANSKQMLEQSGFFIRCARAFAELVN